MTAAVGRTWSRLTITGKFVFTPSRSCSPSSSRSSSSSVLWGGAILDFLQANLALVRFVVAVTAILLMTVPTAFLIIFMEMKVIALMNLRIGPDRVGPFGSLLSVVHGLKVLMKEDFTPTGADSIVFTLGPGRRLPGQRHDAARHPVRARACSARTSTSACCTSSPSAACPSSGC